MLNTIKKSYLVSKQLTQELGRDPLPRDFLPSSWAGYQPTSIEIATLIGSFGLFFTCFLLFCRIAPVIAFSEVKHTLGSKGPE